MTPDWRLFTYIGLLFLLAGGIAWTGFWLDRRVERRRVQREIQQEMSRLPVIGRDQHVPQRRARVTQIAAHAHPRRNGKPDLWGQSQDPPGRAS